MVTGHRIAGYGLGHFPPGATERELRKERKKLIRECRRSAETIFENGRKWTLVKLPDGFAADYPVDDVRSDAA